MDRKYLRKEQLKGPTIEETCSPIHSPFLKRNGNLTSFCHVSETSFFLGGGVEIVTLPLNVAFIILLYYVDLVEIFGN